MRNRRQASRLGMLLGLVALGCSRSASDEPDPISRPLVEVRIDSVRVGTVAATVRATGVTRALRSESIGSPVDGKLAELRVLEGDRVEPGEVLARVETKESLAARTGSEILLARATTPAERARAAADAERARQSATTLEVRAPFGGVVVARPLNDGEFVSAGGTIVTLVDLASICFVARVPARDMPQIQLGQTASVEFDGWPDRAFRCRVDNIKPQVDPAAQTAELRLRFLDRVADLRTEMFGMAAIVVGRHEDALLVPDAAVLRNEETGAQTIVEAVDDTLGVVRQVAVGIATPSAIEIRGPGVRAGMHVVVEGHYGLPDSTRIRLAAAGSP